MVVPSSAATTPDCSAVSGDEAKQLSRHLRAHYLVSMRPELLIIICMITAVIETVYRNAFCFEQFDRLEYDPFLVVWKAGVYFHELY